MDPPYLWSHMLLTIQVEANKQNNFMSQIEMSQIYLC